MFHPAPSGNALAFLPACPTILRRKLPTARDTPTRATPPPILSQHSLRCGGTVWSPRSVFNPRTGGCGASVRGVDGSGVHQRRVIDASHRGRGDTRLGALARVENAVVRCEFFFIAPSSVSGGFVLFVDATFVENGDISRPKERVQWTTISWKCFQ